jgi:chaperone required for assembly of F1-ATPase
MNSSKVIEMFTVTQTSTGFTPHRDGKLLKTPAGADFVVPSAALAEAVAAEWRAQGKKVNPASMPLTQLAATAIDILGRNRPPVVEQIAAYAHSDLLCHRAESPDELIERQYRVWQPVLDWCAKRFGVTLNVGTGIMPVAQPVAAIKTLRNIIENYDNFRLVGLQQATHVSGSLVLGLALAERRLTAAQVFDAAELDATFQIEKWGEDAAIIKRRAEIKRDLEVYEKWLGLQQINQI